MLEIKNERKAGQFTVRTYVLGECIIDALRPAAAEDPVPFFASKVVKRHIEWWNFKVNHHGYRGKATIESAFGEHYIALSTKHHLDQVIPLNRIDELCQTEAGDFVGGPDIEVIITAKEEIAKHLGLEPCWTMREAQMRPIIAEARRKAAEEARCKEEEAKRAALIAAEKERRLAAEAERAKRAAEKAAKRKKLESRRKLYVFTLGGERKFGIPVTGDEWKSLAHDTYCIRVSSYDEATGEAGAVLEAFVVWKDGSKVTERGNIAVTKEKVGKQLATPRLPSLEYRAVPVKRGEETEMKQVILAPNMDFVRQLNTGGLNSGTLVTAPVENAVEKYAVYSLEGGLIKTVCEVPRDIVRP